MAKRYQQLKPRPGSSGKVVADHQRNRMLGATIELVDEVGYGSLTVAAIIEAAGVSKHTFYENFRDKEDCFLSTYETIVRHAAREVLAARRGEQEAQARLYAGLRRFLRVVAEWPKAARLAFLAGPELEKNPTRARLRKCGLLERVMADSLIEFDDSIMLSPFLRRGVAAGIGEVARAFLLTERQHELPQFADELTDWALSVGGDRGMVRSTLPAISTSRVASLPADRPLQSSLRREHGAGDEREMILSSVARLAAGSGNEELTVTQIRTTAGLSRRRFERHFAGVDDCLLEALELLAQCAIEEARTEYLSAENWLFGVHRAIHRLCECVARDRALMKMASVELYRAGAESLRWRADFISKSAAFLRSAFPPENRPSIRAAEASVGSMFAVIRLGATGDSPSELPTLVDTLTRLALAAAEAVPNGKNFDQERIGRIP
jgi:AcrR family transcriptional regulator